MTDDEKEKLLYRPNLQPDKDYLSDGSFSAATTDVPAISTDEDTDDTTPRQLYDDFQEIVELYNDLPEGVQFFAKSIEKLQLRVVIIYPEGTIPKKITIERSPKKIPLSDELNQIGHIPIESNPALVDMPSLFPKTNNVVLTIQEPDTLVELIQGAYSKDQVALDQYYLQKLQIIMRNYFQQMLALMVDTGVSSIDDLTKDFDGDEVKIPSGQGLEHLRDFIVRSQASRDQCTRLFKKTHSVDNTLLHMRAWEAAEAQRERYYGEEYKDSTSYSDSHSNSLLRESRSSYDAAYNSAFYNMYKYLNSSALMTNDILTATLKEAQAKGELLKNGVDIYAFNKADYEFEQSATDSGQVGDGTGSGFDTASTNSSDSNSSNSTDSSNSSSNSTNNSSSSSSSTSSSSNSSNSSSSSLSSSSTSSSTDFSSLFKDITNSVSKNITSGITKTIENSSTSDIGKTTKNIVNSVLSSTKSTVSSTLTTQLNDVISSAVTKATKTYSNEEKAKMKSIKTQITQINTQINNIKKERKTRNDSTYAKETYDNLTKQLKTLKEEYNKLTS